MIIIMPLASGSLHTATIASNALFWCAQINKKSLPYFWSGKSPSLVHLKLHSRTLPETSNYSYHELLFGFGKLSVLSNSQSSYWYDDDDEGFYGRLCVCPNIIVIVIYLLFYCNEFKK
jgi:hypothetical protein